MATKDSLRTLTWRLARSGSISIAVTNWNLASASASRKTPAPIQGSRNRTILEFPTPPEDRSNSGKFPLSWLETAYPDSGSRDAIRALYQLGDISDSLDEFENFVK